jgi:hypothetical protein
MKRKEEAQLRKVSLKCWMTITVSLVVDLIMQIHRVLTKSLEGCGEQVSQCPNFVLKNPVNVYGVVFTSYRL